MDDGSKLSYSDRSLVRPMDALALIHMGYNPDEATRKGSDLPHEVIQESFGNPEGSLFLFNYGGEVSICDVKRFTQHEHPPRKFSSLGASVLPTFGVFTVTKDGDSHLMIHPLHLDDNTQFSHHHFLRARELKAGDFGGCSGYFIQTEGDVNYEVRIIGFSEDSGFMDKDESIKGANVIVPFLPVDQRDSMYWSKVSEMHKIVLGGAVTQSFEHGSPIVSYSALMTESDNIESLKFSSSPKYQEGEKLEIEAVFKKAVNAEQFREFNRLFRGYTDISLDGESISYEGDLEGTVLSAKIPKGRTYLATGLIERILEV
jgi:hypothetical protein